MEVDDKTDGSGLVNTMTYDQARVLNAAANPKWQGSAGAPATGPTCV